MPRLLRGIARTAAVAGTATVVSNRVSRRQAGRWADQDQQAANEQQMQSDQQQAPQAPQAPAAPDMSAQIQQLQQLAQLKDQGVLTDAEFAEQKRRILG